MSEPDTGGAEGTSTRSRDPLRITAPGRGGSIDTRLALVLLALGIISRLLAVPASLWEWDDVLFARALHRFDVPSHSPHPPGFPVFVMMGRLAYALLGDDRLAYAAVSLVFGAVLGVSLFYFYREVFADSMVALAAALIGSFAPNVWVQGSALRSDGPALTLAIIALTLAIRGLASGRALLFASVLFGLSMGVRVTLLPIVGPTLAVVLLARLRARRFGVVAAALLLAAGAVLSWYVPLVAHTGWRAYRAVVAQHAQYTMSTDSVLAANASAALRFRIRRFFVDIWGARWIMAILYLASALGAFLLVRRRQWRSLGWLCLAFVPFLVFSVLINTPLAAPLYSLPYVPLFAGLTGFAVVVAPRLGAERARRPALAHGGMVLAGAIVLAMVGWTYPVVAMMRRDESPPVRAMEHVLATVDPSRDVLYYDPIFAVHRIFYLPALKNGREGLGADVNLIDPLPDRRFTYSLTTEPVLGVGGRAFHWSSRLAARRLFGLSLGRFFDAYVTGPLDPYPLVFLSGWFPQEHRRDVAWRWMGARSLTGLYDAADHMTLRLRAQVPPTPTRPTIVVRVDGAEVDRFVAVDDVIDRAVAVRPESGRIWSILSIDTGQSIPGPTRGPSGDDRLGLQCLDLRWSSALGALPRVTSREQFLGPGWSALERNGLQSWRWTGERAVTYLPPIAGDGRLEITMWAPRGRNDRQSTVTVEVSGQVIDRIQPPPGGFTRSYRVPASLLQGAPPALTLSAEPVKVADDDRTLGVLVTRLGWLPEDGAAK